MDLPAFKIIFALGGWEHARKDLDQGRFPGPVIAQQAGDFPPVDRSRDVAEGDYTAEQLGNIAYFQDGLRHLCIPRSAS